MRRWPMIVTAAVAAAVCAGCASSDHASSLASGSGQPSAPVSSSAIMTASPPLVASMTAVPGASFGPTGPAATAATASPPARAAHAVAAIDGATVSCPDGVPLIAGPDREGRRPLLAGAKIVAVVRCETVVRTYSGLGQWSVQIAEVADSGLGDFVSALHAPSQKAPANVICPLAMIAVPWFAVVDSSGHVLLPSLPTNQCGQPAAKAIIALNKLDFRAVDVVLGKQIEPSAAVSCGNLAQGVPAIPTIPPMPTATPSPSIVAGSVGSPPSRVVCPYSK